MNVSVMTTTMTHKFKYPHIFKLLEQVEVSELENYGIFEKIGNVLRLEFTSLKDMEARQWICTFVSGDRQFKKFKKEFQEMIYHTFSKRDISIMIEWSTTVDKTTPRSVLLRVEKKKIYDRMFQRYTKIVAFAFGPSCVGCKDKSKLTYSMNCDCRLKGICLDCLSTNVQERNGHHRATCPKCFSRISIFKDTSNKHHSLGSLFQMEEAAYSEDEEEDEEDEEEEIEPRHKRFRSENSYGTPSMPIRSPNEVLGYSGESSQRNVARPEIFPSEVPGYSDESSQRNVAGTEIFPSEVLGYSDESSQRDRKSVV